MSKTQRSQLKGEQWENAIKDAEKNSKKVEKLQDGKGSSVTKALQNSGGTGITSVELGVFVVMVHVLYMMVQAMGCRRTGLAFCS